MRQGRMKYVDKSKERCFPKRGKEKLLVMYSLYRLFFLFKIDSLYEEF